jgi:hypothetical protein
MLLTGLQRIAIIPKNPDQIVKFIDAQPTLQHTSIAVSGFSDSDPRW